MYHLKDEEQLAISDAKMTYGTCLLGIVLGKKDRIQRELLFEDWSYLIEGSDLGPEGKEFLYYAYGEGGVLYYYAPERKQKCFMERLDLAYMNRLNDAPKVTCLSLSIEKEKLNELGVITSVKLSDKKFIYTVEDTKLVSRIEDDWHTQLVSLDGKLRFGLKHQENLSLVTRFRDEKREWYFADYDFHRYTGRRFQIRTYKEEDFDCKLWMEFQKVPCSFSLRARPAWQELKITDEHTEELDNFMESIRGELYLTISKGVSPDFVERLSGVTKEEKEEWSEAELKDLFETFGLDSRGVKSISFSTRTSTLFVTAKPREYRKIHEIIREWWEPDPYTQFTVRLCEFDASKESKREVDLSLISNWFLLNDQLGKDSSKILKDCQVKVLEELILPGKGFFRYYDDESFKNFEMLGGTRSNNGLIKRLSLHPRSLSRLSRVNLFLGEFVFKNNVSDLKSQRLFIPPLQVPLEKSLYLPIQMTADGKWLALSISVKPIEVPESVLYPFGDTLFDE